MLSRKQYLNKECTHSEYYGQYVTEDTKRRVLQRFSKEELEKAYAVDEHLNTIPLHKWDTVGISVDRQLLADNGDHLTMAGLNCIRKEAARRIINED